MIAESCQLAARKSSVHLKGESTIPYIRQRFHMIIKCLLIVSGSRIHVVIFFQSRKLRYTRKCPLLWNCLVCLSLYFHKGTQRNLQNNESLFHLKTISLTFNPFSISNSFSCTYLPDHLPFSAKTQLHQCPSQSWSFGGGSHASAPFFR